MNVLETILYLVLSILIMLVVALIIVFIILKKKEKQSAVSKDIILNTSEVEKNKVKTKIAKEYETKSIFDFMEFENVKDNMIIQKKGKRFLMAIECKGVNYDLMSEVEKVATEQGFSEFLNSLKEPIQIYIQTRTVNLEKNIQDYKKKLNQIRDDLNLKEYRLNQYKQQEYPNEKVIKDQQFEVARENNLYEYGKDIVADTERMSLNKNVLKKKYYIILKYYYEPSDSDQEYELTEEEIADIAFSNLYTKAASVVRILAGIGISANALNSFELVDLLYNAYNRDDSEVFGIERALDAGYNEIYVDSQNIIDKKIAALNREIEIKAQQKAQETLEKVLDERSDELQELEQNIDDEILELAQRVIENQNIPKAIRDEVIKRLGKIIEKKKGEDASGTNEKTKSTTRKRRKQ